MYHNQRDVKYFPTNLTNFIHFNTLDVVDRVSETQHRMDENLIRSYAYLHALNLAVEIFRKTSVITIYIFFVCCQASTSTV